MVALTLGGALGLAGCGDVENVAEDTGPPNIVEELPAAAPDGKNAEDVAAAVESVDVVVADAATIRKAIDTAKGLVTAVNFWATWCPPCVKEMPALVAFYEAHRDAGLKFISLSGDHHSTLEDNVKSFAEEHALPFDVYVMEWDDPADMDEIATTLDLGWDGVFPTTYILDRDGNIVFSKAAEITREELDAAVAPLLDE